MSARDREPTAWAELRSTLTGNVWHVDRCPFCRQAHNYPAGQVGGDPARFLGPRLSLCPTARWLVLEETRPT